MTASQGQAIVIGAGVTGLTTAICLAEAGWPVQIWTAEAPQQTTSAVAGALWGPSFQEPMAKTLAWTERSLHEFRRLAEDPDSGVRMASSLAVGDLPPADALPPQVRLIPDLRPCAPDELPDGFRAGFRASMPLIDMPRYLDYLSLRLISAGGKIEIHRVRSLDEAATAATVVANCSGLGARQLANDPSVRPVRGQHVIVTNPGLEMLFMELSQAAEWTSYFPHRDRVVCGGINVPDSWDTTPDERVTERLLSRCRRIEPRLVDAEVLDTVVGLRPDRPSIRVELETIGLSRCVHNYGHGGNGVSLSWGAAREAVRLLEA
jgi:D-amino-acid oxidase